MKQGSLWDVLEARHIAEPMPPHNGTETSREAAESVRDDVGRQEAMILALLDEAGSDGMTDDEIEVATGLRHESASARRRGLVLKGLVVDSGKVRPTRRGRKAVCWVLAEDREMRPAKEQSE